ncbi:MAG: hypothetical protein JSW58_15605 [Candidatus Latescibacterota bacterium]|nr:MAG: hypothetical protein JSW58_15605 [Candidatus Latescibacterota bacterium]
MRPYLAAMVVLLLAVPVFAEIVTSHLSSDAEMLAVLENVAIVAEGRIGDLGGPATHELDLGDDTGNPDTTAQYV